MNKNLFHVFLGKAAVGILTLVLMLSAVCLLDVNGSVAQAADADYFITEACEGGITVSENMTAPKPTTSGKESYIFAGYYAEAECTTPVRETTTETVYAKFVPADIMNVKVQVSPGTNAASNKTDMRLVTTVDTLNYKEVGFEVYFNGATDPVVAKTTTVYKRILVTGEDGVEYGYSPTAFADDAEYFTTVNLINIANKNFDKSFFIKPYWKTMDGTTVYGMSRMARVADSYNKIVNVPVRLYTTGSVAAGSMDVAYDTDILTYVNYDNGDLYESVTVADDAANKKVTVTTPAEVTDPDGMVVNLRFQVNDGATMPSNTTFGVTSDTFTDAQIADVVYNEFSITYSGTPDTTWYDEFADGDTFVIATPDDLYGLAELVNTTKVTFSGKTVNVGADIIVNEGTVAQMLAAAADADATNNPYEWTAIGVKDTSKFTGTFEGNGNTIRGIYLIDDATTSTEFHGLFGITANGSTIRNFRIEDSYFESVAGYGLVSGSECYAFMGSAVGQLGGNIDTVYSNATIVSGNTTVGGIVGRVLNASVESKIDNCWFDGSLTVNDPVYTGSIDVGGIAAKLQWTGKNLTISNCLNTATITYNYESWGTATNYTLNISQIAGTDGSNAGVITVKQSVAAGKLVIEASDYDPANTDNFCSAGTLTNNVDVTTDGAAAYNGYKGYVEASELGFYDADSTDATTNGKWVCRETDSTTPLNGIPVLESFCDEWIDVSWYYDDTSAAEYTIKTAEELYGVSELSNILKTNFAGKTIRLGADIELNAGKASVWVDDEIQPKRDWTPINSVSTAANGGFNGTFDGAGHTISGIWVNQPSVTGYGAGLFGYVYKDAILTDFRIENSYINSTTPYSGSVAGFYGGKSMEKVYSNAYVKSSANDTGGLVGRFGLNFNGDITESWFDGEVSSSAQNVGGLAGLIRQGGTGYTKKMTDCLVTGKITSTYNGAARVGGLAGYIDQYSTKAVAFTDCLSACEEINTVADATYVGSVMGYIQSTAAGTHTFKDVYTTSATGGDITGLGNSTNVTTIKGEPAVVAETELAGEGAYINMDLDFTDTWGAVEGSKPVLKNLYKGTVMTDLDAQKISTDWYYNHINFNKTMDDATTTYTILDEADLYGFSRIAQAYDFSEKTVQLDETRTEAYDLNSGWTVAVDKTTGTVTTSGMANTWIPIGTDNARSVTTRFAGIFDGKMKTIKGIYIPGTKSASGFFAYGETSSVIKNFTLENMYSIANWNTGLVVCNTYGSVQNVYVKDTAVVSASGQNIGGIVGNWGADTAVTDANASISNCWFDGTVVSANLATGGVVGIINRGTKTIENCLVSGSVINTLSSSNANNTACTGGIVGRILPVNASTDVTVNMANCLASGTVKANTIHTVGAVLGRAGANSPEVNFTNVYYVNEPTGNTFSVTGAAGCDGNSPKTGFSIMTGSPQQLDDLTGTNAYKYTELDLASKTENTDGVWVLRSDGAPQLNSFADSDVESYAGVQTLAKGWYYNFFTYDANGAVASTAYTILDDDDMFGFADLVNTDKLTFSGLTVALGDDIEFNGANADGTEAEGWANDTLEVPTIPWVPIGYRNSGSSLQAFYGTFDGGNHTITGMYMVKSGPCVGLFGNVQGATIQNLRIENSLFKGDNYGLGSVVGWSQGVTMANVYSAAIVQSTNIQAGGIVGRIQADSTLTDCWFDGNMIVNYTGNSDMSIGGIVGNVFSGTTATTLENCLYTGSIDLTNTYSGTSTTRPMYVGGLIGKCQSGKTYQLTNCFAAGNIDTALTSTTATAVNNLDSVACKSSGTLSATSVYATTAINSTITSTDTTSAVTTATSATRFDEKYVQGYGSRLLTQLPFTSDEAASFWVARLGEVPIPSTMVDVVTNELALAGLGRLDTSWYAEDQKDTDGAYVIDSIEDFYGFIELAKTNTFKDETIKLGANINLNDNEAVNESVNAVLGTDAEWNASEWTGKDILPTLVCGTPIGGNSSKNFAGTFDGNGKTISGFYMLSSADRIGLFGLTDSGSIVKDFRLLNSYIKADKDAGYDWAAAVIADCRGTLSNVYTNATVEGDAKEIGGMVALANTAPSTGSADNYHYTDTSGNYKVYSTTPVIENCWFDGVIKMGSTGRYGGGIVSTVMQGGVNITNCLFTGEINSDFNSESENAYIGGIVGHTRGNFITEVKMSSVVSAGEITGNHNHKGVSAVIGNMRNSVYSGQAMNPTLTFENVFATRDCYPKTYETQALTVTSGDVTSTLTVNGDVAITNNEDRLIGYCDGGSSEFDIDWVMREQGVPVPATFSDMTDIVTPITNAESILALATMDSVWTLKKAENAGLGHYTLTTTGKTYTNYTTYLDALKAQGFKAYVGLSGDTSADTNVGAESATDGVYNVIYTRDAGEWVLNVLFVENTGEVTLTISNGLERLSSDLEPETSTTSGIVTLSMLELTGSSAGLSSPYDNYYYGNSFVFKLPNGHFVISDGGEIGDFEGLIAYLKKLAGVESTDTTTKIIVDAWTVTHQHGDHFGVVRGFESNADLAEQIVVNAIYLNEPNQEAMVAYEEEQVMSGVIAQYRGMNKLKDEQGNKTKVYWCQTGQRYYFDGLTLDIVQSQELIPVSEYGKRNSYSANGTDFNTASTNMLFTTVANDKKVLITGDSNYVNMEYIMNLYGETSSLLADINVYQAPHHGKNTSMSFTSTDNSFTDYLAGLNTSGKFDVTLFPCSVLYQYEGSHENGYVFPCAGNANKYLIENCTKLDGNGEPYAYDYGDGTVKITLGDTISSEVESE